MKVAWSECTAVVMLLPFLLLSCSPPAATAAEEARRVAEGVMEVGRIELREIKESSGLVASRRYPGVFWTHNDGGGPNRQVLYAITRQGKSLARFPLVGVTLSDWEDLAGDGNGYLYVADTGNNDVARKQLAVYQVEEPDPQVTGRQLQPQRAWQLLYPGHPFDCESLVLWGEFGYVISKVQKDQQAEIYRFPLKETGGQVLLQAVARLPITSPVTGADLSPDGTWLGVVCKSGAYVFEVDGDVARAGRVPPWRCKFRPGQIEGCCFVADGLLASAESRQLFLFVESPSVPGKGIR